MRRPTLFRVQAADGRGPWRPGLSHHWTDENRQKFQTDILTAFGLNWKERIPPGMHVGCACRTLDGLLDWFTPLEQRRLEAMGYAPVTFLADRILAENREQVIFARRDPLNVAVVALKWRVETLAV